MVTISIMGYKRGVDTNAMSSRHYWNCTCSRG